MSIRPKPDDDYDEVLRQQSEYLQKNPPSAKFERVKKPVEKTIDEFEHPEKNVSEIKVQVLTKIKEKIAEGTSKNPLGHPDGFPGAFKLEGIENTGPRAKTKSLFKQRMEAKRNQKKNRDTQPSKYSGDIEDSCCDSDAMYPSSSIHEDEDLKKIHLENSRRLAELSTGEIEAQRNELISKMDPKLLDFIRKRKNPTESNPKPKEEPEPEKKIYKTEAGSDVKVPIKKNVGWVNMDNVEPDKLEWMQDIQIRNIEGEVKMRFDLQGEIMNPTKEISWREGLHHHGEDEQLAGYTLQELLGLSNSRVLKQRIIAFKALAAVIRKSRLRKGDRTLLKSPKLLLQAGLIVVVRRELDSESTQSQTIALDLLYALLGPLIPTHVRHKHLANQKCPCGTFIPFDESEAESLGDGLIDHSAKELISSMIFMNIIPRFRFLLGQENLPEKAKIRLLEILSVFGNHSLSVAQKMFDDASLCHELIKLFDQDAYRDEIAFIFNEMIKNGRNLAKRIFDLEDFQTKLTKSIFERCETPIGKALLSSLLRMGVGVEYTECLMQRLMENLTPNIDIIINFFIACEKNSKNYQKLIGIAKSLDKSTSEYLKLLNFVIKYSLQTEGKQFTNEMLPDLMPCYSPVSLSKLKENFKNMKQVNINSDPLPSLLYDFHPLEEIEFVTNLIQLATVTFSDKETYRRLIQSLNINLADFFDSIVDHLVLSPEIEEFLAAIVEFSLTVIRSTAPDDFALVASCHQIGLRATLLVSPRYSNLQLDFISTFFTGSAFIPTNGHVEVQTEILSTLAPLRGMMIDTMKSLISSKTIDRARDLGSISKCETLSFNGPGLSSSLPADLPFYKIIELGTIYSSPDHQFSVNKLEMENHLVELENSMKLVHFLLLHRSKSIILSGPALFSRIVCIFLCPPDISHSPKITRLIMPLLNIAVSQTTLVQNVVVPIAGIPSFTDYFMRLCDSFEGQGYGLKPFAAALMISMIHSTELRLIVWGDRQPMLRTVVNSTKDLVIPFDHFIKKKETNMKLVQLYLAAVASKTITYERNEALYLFALVQINQFIFNLEIRENFREQILVLVLSAEQDLRKEILFFDKIENGSNVVVWNEESFNPDKLRWIKSVDAKLKK